MYKPWWKIIIVIVVELLTLVVSPMLSLFLLILLMPNQMSIVNMDTWKNITREKRNKIRFRGRLFFNYLKKFSFGKAKPFYPKAPSDKELRVWVAILGTGVVKNNSQELSWFSFRRISFWMSIALSAICGILHYWLAQHLLSSDSLTVTYNNTKYKIPFTHWCMPYISFLFGFCFFSAVAEAMRITRYVYSHYTAINNGINQYFAAAINWRNVKNIFGFFGKIKRRFLKYLSIAIIIAIILYVSIEIAIKSNSIIRAEQFGEQPYILAPILSSLFSVCLVAIFLLWRLSQLAKREANP